MASAATQKNVAVREEGPKTGQVANWLTKSERNGETEVSRYIGQILGSERDQTAIAAQIVNEFKKFAEMSPTDKRQLVRDSIYVAGILSTTKVAEALKDPIVEAAITNFLKVPEIDKTRFRFNDTRIRPSDRYMEIAALTAEYLAMGRFEFLQPWLQKADSLKTLATDIEVRTATLEVCNRRTTFPDVSPHMAALRGLTYSEEVMKMARENFKASILSNTPPKEALAEVYNKYVKIWRADSTALTESVARNWLNFRKELLLDANGPLADQGFLKAALEGKNFASLIALKKFVEEQYTRMLAEDDGVPGVGGKFYIFTGFQGPVVTPLCLNPSQIRAVAELLMPKKARLFDTAKADLSLPEFQNLFGADTGVKPAELSKQPLFVVSKDFYEYVQSKK